MATEPPELPDPPPETMMQMMAAASCRASLYCFTKCTPESGKVFFFFY
jgi:hypothetical protein